MEIVVPPSVQPARLRSAECLANNSECSQPLPLGRSVLLRAPLLANICYTIFPMPDDKHRQQIREMRENQRKILTYARALHTRFNDAMDKGQFTEANTLYGELTKAIKDMEQLQSQLYQLCTVMDKRAKRAKQKEQRQRTVH